MPVAVISDVHSNIEALGAVLVDIAEHNIPEIYFLGDAIGYGPSPNECMDLLRARCRRFLAGNHDYAAVGLMSTAWFNPVAKAAILWTAQTLTKAHSGFLSSLPIQMNAGDDVIPGGIRLVHSSPYEPELWHYLRHPYETAAMFEFFPERVCFVGHSHVPFVAELAENDQLIGRGFGHGPIEFRPGSRYIINVGSVGQPRDGDPRAAYAIFDSSGIDLRRVSYPIEKTQSRMRAVNLPAFLIDRLSRGQ